MRTIKTQTCEACGTSFPAKVVIGGKIHSLYRRRFCLDCSPFGIHNTSRTPPGPLSSEDLTEYRRRRRNGKTYRYHKKRRKRDKDELVALSGGRCQDCGYSACSTALEFHHRDAHQKDFSISHFGGSWQTLVAEARKCDLLCANCHRLRHLAEDMDAKGGPVVASRRVMKARAVAFMGGVCLGCRRAGPSAIFEFHHRDATLKDFGITQDGIPRRWEKIAPELEKCVMLCANCHREVHAGLRQIDKALPELAEDAPLDISAA